jgi:hypothetical protein
LTDKNQSKRPYITIPTGWECIGSEGPGPFVTQARFETPKGNLVSWSSRHHRKHHFLLDISLGSTWWAPGAIGWWIGILFAIGSVCFALGSVPAYANAVGILGDDLTYFIGSIFFTSAGLLQYIETVSTPHKFGGKLQDKIKYILFEPQRIDWWSTLIQLIGTLFFNLSTFAAIISFTILQSKVYVWVPDVYGSICFLIASYLAYSEAGHSFFSFKIKSLPWWIAFINLLGSLAFGVSALGAFTPLTASQPWHPLMMVWGTFIGAVCFFIAAVLLLPERTQTNKIN